MHYYGDILVAFHGKAKNLQRLAQLVWKRPDLEELADGLNGIHAVDGDAASTITVNLGIDCLNAELPCIDFLANHGSGVEIAVIAWLYDSITDTRAKYSVFYPLDRELYEDEEDGEENDEEYFDFDPLDYLEYREDHDSWFDAYPDWLQAWEHNGFR